GALVSLREGEPCPTCGREAELTAEQRKEIKDELAAADALLAEKVGAYRAAQASYTRAVQAVRDWGTEVDRLLNRRTTLVAEAERLGRLAEGHDTAAYKQKVEERLAYIAKLQQQRSLVEEKHRLEKAVASA